ncbi:MAG: NrfD/PsrC family molybdoenzyme membrane anchor subunit [Fimbriimonadaceae bacterium]
MAATGQKPGKEHVYQEEILIDAAEHHDYETITDGIGRLVLNQKVHERNWLMVFFFGFLLVNVLMLAVGWLLYNGIGIWGNNQPAGWGFDIINFVWWIGIGHAGTLISAILLLMRQRWRMSINRFAEAMTIFAVMCAGLFPLLHTGRPWVAYWLFPYPNWMGLWPQFRSPLVWDVFAVSTYFTVSLLFWALGLIPDFAALRDRAKNRGTKVVMGMLSLGWRGSAKHWERYEQAYRVLAALSTPLVLSVHSIVSFDFAVSLVPGWHATIFPPYFVAGAVYAGFAMVLTFAIPIRAWYKMKDFITIKHIDWMCKIMLATGLIVFYGYCVEAFYGYYSGNIFEMSMIVNRQFGPYKWYYWTLIICNGIIPQLLWWPGLRKGNMYLPGLQNLPILGKLKLWRNLPIIGRPSTSLAPVWIICMVVSVGMWLERFIIIPISLHRDYLPSSWGFYIPTFWDFAMFAGTIGFFIFMMFLFVRFVPIISIFEMRELLHRYKHKSHPPEPVLAGSSEGEKH